MLFNLIYMMSPFYIQNEPCTRFWIFCIFNQSKYANKFLDFGRPNDFEKICTYIFNYRTITAHEFRYKLIAQNASFVVQVMAG